MKPLTDTTTAWGFSLSANQIQQFETYAEALREWNARLNLTAITDDRGIVVRHFLDSLTCARVWGSAPDSLIDIGTGAGFPGMPLKLLRPELRLTLVESIEKKTAFLHHMVALLGLEDVTILSTRAEALGRDTAHREGYAVAVARAVADLRILAEYCLPFCRIGGVFLAPKGGQIDDELTRALPAFERLGGRLVAREVVDLPGVEPRTIVVVEKVSPTPDQYPRAVGVPSKRPLG